MTMALALTALVPLVMVELAGPTGAELVWTHAPRAGWQSVRTTDGRWARVRMCPERRILVARRAVARGARVTAGDLALEPRGDCDQRGLEIPPHTLVGAPVRRDLAAGAVVSLLDLEIPPPVSRGTAVTVIAGGGGVRVAAPGILETAARPGERAAARLDDRRLVVHGRLLDGSTFLVETGERK